MTGVSNVLAFMVGNRLFDVELPKVSDECMPYLKKQFPQLCSPDIDADVENLANRLEGVDVPNYCKRICKTWLADMVQKYGEWFEVEQIHIAHPIGVQLLESTPMIAVVVIKDNVVDMLWIYPDCKTAEDKFLEECSTRLRNWDGYTEDDKQAILDDGYAEFEFENGSICIAHPSRG
jgi:hypothetical protein